MPRRLALPSWVLYDFANTIFSMNIVTLYFSLWVTNNNGKADMWISVANGLSALLIVLALPLLGVWSDANRRKQAYLVISTVACCALTAGMGLTARSGLGSTGRVLAAVAFFVLANFAYHAGLVFYNALLTSVADEKRLGRVSGWGVAAGYLGAIVGLFMVMPFADGTMKFFDIPGTAGEWKRIAVVQQEPEAKAMYVDTPVEREANYNYQFRDGGRVTDASCRDLFLKGERAYEVNLEGVHQGAELYRRTHGWGRSGTFLPTGILFFIFALPCMIWVREKSGAPAAALGVKQAYQKVWKSLRATRDHPGLLRFMIGKYFYEDAISTVYIFMAVYGSKVLKFTDGMQATFLITATTFAMVGSFACGYVTDRIGSKRTLELVLVGWVLFLSAAAMTTEARNFWVIGPGLGVLLGSMWTASRPLLVSLVPEASQGEFFALSELTGKMSAVIGPLIWGAIILVATRNGVAELRAYQYAIGAMVVLIVIGWLIIQKVPDIRVKKSEPPVIGSDSKP